MIDNPNFRICSGIVGGIVATLLLTWLASRTNKTASTIGDKKVLCYEKPIRAIGWMAISFSLIVFYAIFKSSKNDPATNLCVGTFFLLIGSILFLELQFVKILFDDDFIYTFSPWRRARKIPWTSISGYAFSDINKWHILKTDSFGKIRLSILLSGLGSFSEELQKRKLPDF